MDLDEIKRGLRAEIKKRENEQYLTFQCNVRQMCKDVLAKLEEQESEIAELVEKHKTEVKELLCLIRDKENNFNRAFDSVEKELRHQKYKRCIAMAIWCAERCERYDLFQEHSGFSWRSEINFYFRWYKRWLKLAEQFKDKEAK